MTPFLHLSKTSGVWHHVVVAKAITFLHYFPVLFLIIFVGSSYRSGNPDKVVASLKTVPVIQPLLPEAYLVSKDKNSTGGLYYFDTIPGERKHKDKVVITDTARPSGNTLPGQGQPTENKQPFSAPVMPGKITGNSPVMVVKIDPGSFGELKAFDNLKFQIDESVKKFNPRDSAEEWNDLTLNRGNDPGKYIIKFSNARRTVSYTTRPVLAEKDLARAGEIYRLQYELYNRQLAAWRVVNKNAREELLIDSLADVALQKEGLINIPWDAAIQARTILVTEQKRAIGTRSQQAYENDATKKMDAQISDRKKLIEAAGKRIGAEKQVAIEKQKKMAAGLEQKVRDRYYMKRLYRSFEMDGFVIWDNDGAPPPTSFAVAASFVDSAGHVLNMV